MSGLDQLLQGLLRGVDLEGMKKSGERKMFIETALSTMGRTLVNNGHDPIDVVMDIARVTAEHLGQAAFDISDSADDHDAFCTASVAMATLLEFSNSLNRACYHATKNSSRTVSVETDADGAVFEKQETPVPDGAKVVATGFDIFIEKRNATPNMQRFGHIDANFSLPEGKHPHFVPAGCNDQKVECCSNCIDQGFLLRDTNGLKMRFFDFRDKEGVKKYNKTGLCQRCQDEGDESEQSPTT